MKGSAPPCSAQAAAAREAGLAPEHVRRALAEERLRAARAGTSGVVAGRGLAARLG